VTLRKVVLLFLAGAIGGGVAWAALAVWVFHTTDSKFDQAPILALEIELVASLALAAIGASVLASVGYLVARGRFFAPTLRLVPLLAGALYSAFVSAGGNAARGWLGAESPAVILVAGLFVFLIPLATFVVVFLGVQSQPVQR